MSKVSFRARALDASKPMPIYMAEELPDLPDYSAINRVVPQMPSGMQKEEECEHHLQRAICAGLIIPTPEVTGLADVELYEKIYPADYKLPRQLIHMQPFAMEQDIPDYDMDSEDEIWILSQRRKMDLSILQFEEMMDRLEKSSGQSVVTLNEAKSLLKEDDDMIIAVFDYWLNKRLKTQHPLLLNVRTEHRIGTAANNPYLAFRRRTEKMITRKNRKNDETSYEKMLKLRRDLSRAVTLLELVKKREKTKREYLHLTVEVYEKRYQAQDFSGQLFNEVSATKSTAASNRLAFAPLFASNQYLTSQNWANKLYNAQNNNSNNLGDESGAAAQQARREKRQYKKRKFAKKEEMVPNCRRGMYSSDEEQQSPAQDEGKFAFRRNKNNCYLPPVSGNWPWCDKVEGGQQADSKYKFVLTSINHPKPRCVGLARRRMGRGGRVILDRYSHDEDDLWSSLDFTVHYSPVVSNNKTDEESSDELMPVENDVKGKFYTDPFSPNSASSIYVDFEGDEQGTEFNVIDYFSADRDRLVTDDRGSSQQDGNIDWRIDIGCSNISVRSGVQQLSKLTNLNSNNKISQSLMKQGKLSSLKNANQQPCGNDRTDMITTKDVVVLASTADGLQQQLINKSNKINTSIHLDGNNRLKSIGESHKE